MRMIQGTPVYCTRGFPIILSSMKLLFFFLFVSKKPEKI